MRSFPLLLKLAFISIFVAMIVGVWFYETKYIMMRADGVEVEVSKARYLELLADFSFEQSEAKHYSFNYMLAIISLLLTFSLGLILRLFKGPRIKREVNNSSSKIKNTDENIRDNIHPDSTFMG
jgi:hypothetical protein